MYIFIQFFHVVVSSEVFLLFLDSFQSIKNDF